MDSKTQALIAKVSNTLDADPASIVAGELRTGVSNPSSGVAEWDSFLSDVNGGRFGSFDIWSVEELQMNQVFASAMPGGEDHWLVIGQMIYEPIGVNRKSGEIVCFPEGREVIELGDVRSFVADFLLGNSYAKVIPNSEQDEWWQVLRSSSVLSD